MVKRVARAMRAKDFEEGHCDPETTIESYIGTARAAIEAMREPTAAMINSGGTENGDWTPDNSAAACRESWQAMIDEALK